MTCRCVARPTAADDDAAGHQEPAGRRRTGTHDWVECGQWIRELRPHIDLYLLTDESIAALDRRRARHLRPHLLPAQRRHRPVQHAARRHPDVASPHRSSTRCAPTRGAGRPVPRPARRAWGQHLQLEIAAGHGRVLRPQHLHGRDVVHLAAGWIRCWTRTARCNKRWTRRRSTWCAEQTYFVTNGTSTANKIVVQSLARPGDIVLIDRNCHKSHHYGLVLAGANPLYLDAYPLEPYAIYGAVSLRTIKKALLDLEAAGQLHRVRMLLLTNCTFDGIVYNPRRVMEEVLAIKPDICFLWDEAWYAFATAVPWSRQRTAMVAADQLETMLSSPEYAEEYRQWRESMRGVDRSQWIEHRLLPDPDRARVRVYSTHSTHKSLSALRQASMIHIRDQDFNTQSRDAFGEAFLTHTSTSPNQQLLASLDLARRQVDIEGFQLVRYAYNMALVFRHRVRIDPLISKWFRILDEADLVPDEYRASGVRSYRQVSQGALEGWNEAWKSDEFVLDPTRVTLFIGKTGMNGYDFREKILMERFGIQINKTSINSVLLIITIGVTWSSIHYLLDALRRVAADFERSLRTASNADRALQQRRVERNHQRSAAAARFQRVRRRVPPRRCQLVRRHAVGVLRRLRRIRPRARPARRCGTTARRGQDPGLDHVRRALPAGIPGAGARSGDLQGDPVLPRPARRQGDSRLQPRTGAVGLHRGGDRRFKADRLDIQR